jgi:hypothetical protein
MPTIIKAWLGVVDALQLDESFSTMYLHYPVFGVLRDQ